ncbi:MAG: hypothetical protein HN368_17680 [Spirochaetales bacterium]|nr:hypothetical protein [Spirochaetales bacterium]
MSGGEASAYKIRYAEQFYKLYHQNFYMYPEDYNENIWYLERALSSDFVNPQNALAEVNTPEEWERYRYLFYMHVNLELIKQYRYLGAEYDKRVAYFYNYPWRDQNLESLRYAESYYETALYYWDQALIWSDKAWEISYIELERAQYWADLNYRIEHYDLDYEDILLGDLERLEKVRENFLAMTEDTY